MLEMGHLFSYYVQLRLLKVALKIWAEYYAAETRYISNTISNSDYVVRLFK